MGTVGAQKTGPGDVGSVPSARERLRSRETAVKVFAAGVTFVALFRINKSAAVVGAMLAPVVSELVTDYVQRHQWSVRQLRRGSAAVAVIGQEEKAYAARRGRGGAAGGGVPGPLLAGLAAIAAVIGGLALSQAATGGSSGPAGRTATHTTIETTFSSGAHPRDHGHHRVIPVGGPTTATGPAVVLSQTSGPNDLPAFSWDRVSDADGYAVYRDHEHIDDIDTSTTTIYTDKAATPGMHRYQVAPVRGGVAGKPSAVLTIDYRPSTHAPPPVTRLSAVRTLTDAAPVLTWDAVPGADSYRLYRDGEPLHPTSATSFVDAKATPGAHAYFVTVVVDGTEGKPSNSVSVDYEPLLAAPTGLVQTVPNTAAFTWTPVLGAVAYNVYRDHELVKQVSEPKYEEGARLADGTYDYSVTAVNELGVEGDESGVLSIQLIG
jgi:fibronectin type 3 domain-containing protein